MFKAASKPPCRLYCFFLQLGDNNFQLQPLRINTFPRCQLPDHNPETNIPPLLCRLCMSGTIIQIFKVISILINYLA
ncbi:Uncharacterized protein HZ326_12667 [Fusarium oxysporum f. sp. albedinis]|nr:Uncharacterized protein HZ326_12667 [Fusarium oxysporum f. sp. albedinis]